MVIRNAFGWKVLCHFPHRSAVGSSVLHMTSLVNQSSTKWDILVHSQTLLGVILMGSGSVVMEQLD